MSVFFFTSLFLLDRWNYSTLLALLDAFFVRSGWPPSASWSFGLFLITKFFGFPIDPHSDFFLPFTYEVFNWVSISLTFLVLRSYLMEP